MQFFEGKFQHFPQIIIIIIIIIIDLISMELLASCHGTRVHRVHLTRT